MQGIILGLSIMFAVGVYAEEPVVIKDVAGLSQRLIAIQDSQIDQGICQADWQEFVAQSGVIKIKLDSYANLVFVPCALWFKNLSWLAYYEFQEKREDNQGMFRAALLPMLDFNKVWYSSQVFQIWRWKSQAGELQIMQPKGDQPDSGSVHSYKWNSAEFRLDLASVYMKNDANAKWEQIPIAPVSKSSKKSKAKSKKPKKPSVKN